MTFLARRGGRIARRKHPRRRLQAERLEERTPLSSQPIITEFAASNGRVLLDGDGNDSDWIEVFNAGDEPVDLDAWHLTDDPGNLTKWSFPAATLLDPGTYLIIFASGRVEADYRDAGGHPHTNFRLDADGDYLALVGPNGATIASEFSTGGNDYPQQHEDISYGVVQSIDETTLVGVGADGKLLTPDATTDALIGQSWTGGAEPFDDGAWIDITTGVGFDVSPPPPNTVTPLRVDFGDSTNNGGGPGGTQAGFLAFEHTGTSLATRPFASQMGVAGSVDVSIFGNTHYRDYAAATGIFAAQSALLSDGPLCNASCTVSLTFDGLVDGDYRLTTYHHTTRFGPSERPPATPFDVLVSDADGTDRTVAIGAIMSDNASAALSTQTIDFTSRGGASVVVDFVRGPSNGGTDDHFALPGFTLELLPQPAVGELVATDIATTMHGVNASSYMRLPFSVPPDGDYNFMTLDVQYDDGFVAYLNGIEIARRNAPGVAGVAPAFDAASTSENPPGNAAISERIDVTPFLGQLTSGAPAVLAVHGLNASAADDDFLVRPVLTATRISIGEPRYFEPPTPGGPNAVGFVGFVGDTRFSVDRGVFDTAADAFDVEITSATPGATIVYTLDASPPQVDATGGVLNGMIYAGPIHIDRTTTLRAMAMAADHRPSNVDTQTYLFLDDVLDQGPTPPVGYPATWGGTFTDWGLDQNADDLKLIAGDANFSLGEAREVIKESLRSLPTLSLVLDVDDVFGAAGGIYANTQADGKAWERAASVELFDPNDPGVGFQIDAGLRIQGFTSRDPNRNPKHSLRLVFRQEYGAAKLDYPFFGADAAQEFDTIVLRSNSQDAWVYDTANNRRGQFIRDQWARATQLAMGHASPHGNWVHLYINGLYWGVYNPTERPDAAFNAAYFGGDKDDYDAIKNHEEVVDGTIDTYRELLALIQNDPNNFSAGYRDLSSAAAYQRLQGNNADGTRNPAYPVLLDVENLIDYMIHNMYAAAQDWPGNYYVGRDRTETSEGFHFFDWDNEHGMKQPVTENRVVAHSRDADSPTKFHQALLSNAEYRLLFADHVHKAFSPGGVLYVDPQNPAWDPAHPERNVPAARWMELSGEIEQALIAEAARWGDVRGIQYTTFDQFQAVRDDLLQNWFPQRSQIVLDQFKAEGLYPDLAAPAFSQPGGEIPPGFTLGMSAALSSLFVNTPLVSPGQAADVLVPSAGDDSLIGATWTQRGFVPGAAGETAWTAGATGVGYEETPGDAINYAALLGTDIMPNLAAVPNQTSVYVRMPFDVDAGFDSADYDRLLLAMKFDDGFVAYLNGVEVARAFAPAVVAWNSASQGGNGDVNAVVYQPFDITQHLDLLQPGENVLAIHGMNATATSSDMLVLPELLLGEQVVANDAPIYYTLDGSDPRLLGGATNPSAALYDGPVPLSATTQVRARSLVGGVWSALTESLFTIVSPLRISELMYHPREAAGAETFADRDEYEFIELQNTSPTATVDLAGYAFTSGISITFPSLLLAPGDFAVVASNTTAFAERYGATVAVAVAGQYVGNLSNGGESIVLTGPLGEPIQSFAFDDAWLRETDGDGFSLVPASLDGDYDDPLNWRSSARLDGSPGGVDPVVVPGDLNGDGIVNRQDAAVLAGGFGLIGGSYRTRGDVNGDGSTTLVDVSMLQMYFGGIAAVEARIAANAPVHAPQALVAQATKRRTLERRPVDAALIERNADRLASPPIEERHTSRRLRRVSLPLGRIAIVGSDNEMLRSLRRGP